MKKPSPPLTTQEKHPGRKSFFSACFSGMLVFVLLGAMFEGVCRLGWMDKAMPLRSVGNYHTQFETKWFKIEEYVKANGGVDVILLGNSMVNTGVDPAVVAARYKELTGQDARIFNFGVEGLTVAPLSDLAQILMEKYHPRVIILFTEMRDYIAGNGDDVASQFLANAFVQQQLGNPSLEGYLESNSAALQHILPFRYASRADFLDTYILDARRFSETTPDGYEADRHIGKDIDTFPDPANPNDAKGFALFKNFKMDPGRIADLQSILAYSASGTTVIVTELPTYRTYYAYLENESDKQVYLDELQQTVAAGGGYYLPTVSSDLIPLEDRVDNHHLNFKGAPIYSNALAEQLAGLCSEQNICLSGGQP
jgi:hypothetical protein